MPTTLSSPPVRLGSHRRRAVIGLVVLVALVVGGSGGAAAAPTQASPGTTAPVDGAAGGRPDDGTGCGDVVHDPDGLLGAAPSLAPAAVQLVAAGVDLRVRVVGALPDVDDVADLLASCPGWLVDERRPERAAWLFVAPREGAASLFYGAGLRSRLGSRFGALRDLYLAGATPVDGTAVAAVLEQLRGLVSVEEPPTDPFGCDQLLWDPTDQLGTGGEAEDAAFALQGEGGDVHVRVEGPADGDIDRRILQLDDVCGWDDGGGRPDDQLVVIVQPSQRSTGIWYGTDWDARLEGRWEDIQERAMNPAFRRGDYDAGLAAGLRQAGDDAPYLPGLPYAPGGSGDGTGGFGFASSDGGSRSGTLPLGPIVLVGLLVVVAWGLQYASWRSKVDSGETDLSFGQYAGSRGGYRRSGSRSFRSSGGGGRRSSSSSRRSSSGGGRRSGGGSTRW